MIEPKLDAVQLQQCKVGCPATAAVKDGPRGREAGHRDVCHPSAATAYSRRAVIIRGINSNTFSLRPLHVITRGPPVSDLENSRLPL